MSLEKTNLGGCFLGDKLVKCAWSASECPLLDFKSSTEPLGSGRCDDTHRYVIGMCVDETMCTGDASNCKDPSRFIEQYPWCTVEYNRDADRIRGTQFALWGTCAIGNVNHCVWSKDDCPSDAQWVAPYELNYYSLNPKDFADKEDDGMLCTCDNVKVGACQADDGYHCAVSEDSCGPESVWLNWQETAGKIDCRVCNPFGKSTHSSGADYSYFFGRTPDKAISPVVYFLWSLVGFGVGFVLVSFFWYCCSRKGKSSGETMTETSRETIENKEIA